MKKLTKQDRKKIIQLIEYNGNMICAQVKNGAIGIGAAICKFISFSEHLKIHKSKWITESYIRTAKRISKAISKNETKFVGTNVIALKNALDITILTIYGEKK